MRTIRLYIHGHRITLSRKREAVFARRVIALTLLLAFAVWATVSLYHKAAPIAAENASILAEGRWETLINEATEAVMAEGEYHYYSFATPLCDSEGNLTSLSVNSRNIAAVRLALIKEINQRISQNRRIRISVPVGTLIAPRYFGGKGFGIRLTAMTYTAVKITVISEVTAVGINQTVHRISAQVTTDTTLYCIDQTASFTYHYTIPLAEHLAFGKIPDSYFEYEGSQPINS